MKEPETTQPLDVWGPAHMWVERSRGIGGWTEEEVREVLAAYGRRPRHLAVAELRGGWENLNLRVEADGERLVLRRYDATDPSEVPWELELLRFLSAQGFPTAPLMERPDGSLAAALSGRPAALFGFVRGRHPAQGDPHAAALAADAVARLHGLTRDLSLPYPRTRVDNRQRLARFGTWERARPPRGEAAATGKPDAPSMLARLAERVSDYAAAFAARLSPLAGQLPRGVVHHDAHGNNLLIDQEGRLAALLDFDDAHETFVLADVAALLVTWGGDHEGDGLDRAAARHVLRAYARRRPLGEAEWELLPDFIALYCLADAAGYISDRVERGTAAHQATADCGQYARYLHLTTAAHWRDRLRATVSIE